MKKLYIIAIIICIGIIKCTKPYNHEISEFDDVLVVQGLLTNDEGPYSVYLSKTISLNSNSVINVEDAMVTIIDQLGNVEVLNGMGAGHYITSAEFQTQPGYEYQLSVVTSDNLEYLSEPVKIIQGPIIDSLYIEFKEEYDFTTNNYLKGISIKLNTAEWENEKNLYFKWDYEETWSLEQKWNGFEFIRDVTPFEDYYGGESDRICWNIDYSNDIILEQATNYSSNKVIGKEIIYLNELNHKPHFGYSILVKQFIINESVYQFWNFLKENNIENGSVFDNIPYNAKSNIECINKDVKVYGYFDAAFKSEKRLNFIPPVYNVNFRNINDNCNARFMKLSDFRQFSFGSTPIYALSINATPDDASIVFTNQQYCIDCSVLCNIEEKPSYWIFK